MNSPNIKVNQIYQHYKTKGFYIIKAVALSTSNDTDGQWQVIYSPLFSDKELLFVRDIEEFFATVEWNQENCSRFELIEGFE